MYIKSMCLSVKEHVKSIAIDSEGHIIYFFSSYPVTLSGVYDSQTFEGFLLQGREMMDDSKSAGTFIASDPLTKLISCQNDQVSACTSNSHVYSAEL